MKHLLAPFLLCILIPTAFLVVNNESDEEHFPVKDIEDYSTQSTVSTTTDTDDESDTGSSSNGTFASTPTSTGSKGAAKWGMVRHKLMPSRRWAKIHEYISTVVARYRKEVYLHKLVENTQYKMPPPFEGVVKARFHGTTANSWRHGRDHKKFMKEYGQQASFGANDETVDAIMLYVKMKLDSMVKKTKNTNEQQRFKGMQNRFLAMVKEIPDAGCSLSFAPHERTLNNVFLFDQGLAVEAENDDEEADDDSDENKSTTGQNGEGKCRRVRSPFLYQTNDEEDTVQGEDDDDDDDDEESADEISTYAVMQAIQYGRNGFGPEAKLDWTNLPEPKEEKEKPMNGFQKFALRFKEIYQSIKKSILEGTKWTANKVWRRKETKNASNLELSEPVLAQRTHLLNSPQKKEILDKADSAIAFVDELCDNSASQNPLDQILNLAKHPSAAAGQPLQQDNAGDKAVKRGKKAPKKSTSAEHKATYRRVKEQLQRYQVHPFDFLAGTVLGAGAGDKEKTGIEFGGLRYTIIGKTANEKKYKKKIGKRDQHQQEKMENENGKCSELANLVEDTLFMDYGVDPEGVELRGRLGAQIANSVIFMKDLRGLLMQMALSIFGSGFIALFFDAFLWPIVITLLTPFLGPWMIPVSIALYSITPLFAETFDSLVIKRAIAMSRGANLLPKKAVLMANFRAALASGTVASYGSIANNAMEYAVGIGWLPMLTMTNMMATATSAAMVPSEIHEAEEQTNEHVLKLIEKGFFPMPNLADQTKTMAEEERHKRHNWFKPTTAISAIIRKHKEENAAKKMTEKQRKAEENEKVLEWFVNRRVDRVMDLTKTTGMARNSLSTGIVLSLAVGFAPFYALQQLGLVTANVVKIILIIFNAPTEILSMGVDRIMSTKGGWDKKKNRRMVGLIMRKAIEQLHHNGPMPIITDDELYNVYYSNFMARRMNKFGKKIVDLMTVAGKFFKYCGGKIVDGVSLLAKMPLVRNLVGIKRNIKEKLQNEFLPLLAYSPIVENWKQDTFYLITYPRLSSVPVISPAALKLETWLMLRGLPFYRITNPFLLTDLFGSQRVPFVELNGKQIMGTTDQIIERLEKWEVAKKSAFLMMTKVNMANNGYTKKEARTELRKKERHIRRTFDEIVTRCLMYDRNLSIDIPYQDYLFNIKIPQNNMGFLGVDEALWKQLVPTLPRFYLKWFDQKLRYKNAKFWELFFKTVAEKREYRPGYEVLGEDEQLVKDLREQQVPMALREIFRRYKRKLYNEMKSQKVREYNSENDTWEVVHSVEQVTKDAISKKSVKYGDLSPDQIAHKVIDALNEATVQINKTKKMMAEKKGTNEPMFLFGEHPTPADASLFAHLVQLFDTPLQIPALKKHIEKAKKDAQNVLVKYVDTIKKRLQWEKWQHSEDPDKKPFNFQSVPTFEGKSSVDTYEGPFDLKYKDVPSVDTTFMEFDDIEEKQEREEFGEEGEEEDDEQQEEKEEKGEKSAAKKEEKGEKSAAKKEEKGEKSAAKKEEKGEKSAAKKEEKGEKSAAKKEKVATTKKKNNTAQKEETVEGDKEAKERREIRAKLQMEREEQQRYDRQQIVTFAMFNEKTTWEKLERRRILYEEPKEPGNFLWRYPKVVEFVARRILRITDCENENDRAQFSGPWMHAVENGLESIEQTLTKTQPIFINIEKVRQQKDNFFSYSVNRFMIARERASTARALFHLMALHFCKRFVVKQQQLVSNRSDDDELPVSSSEHEERVSDTPRTAAALAENEQLCAATTHMKDALTLLKRIHSVSNGNAAKELLKKCDEMMKRLIDTVYDNFEKLIEPVYTHTDVHSEVTSFKPIIDEGSGFFTYMLGEDGASEVYHVDHVLLYYYPDVVQYVLHALMSMIKVSNGEALQLSFTYRFERIQTDVKVRGRREALVATLAELSKELQGTGSSRAKNAAQQKKHIAHALVSFAAAFLCVGKLNEHDKHGCTHFHRQKAHDTLVSLFHVNKDFLLQLDKQVKLFVHQVIVRYNELIAELELDKFSTKIVAELELLPKGPGFFEHIQREYQRKLIQEPPKEVEAEIKAELRKVQRSPELQRMQQRSGFVDNLVDWWSTMIGQNERGKLN